MAILPNPDPSPTPVPTPPPIPEPKPMREPDPDRLPDEEPIPNPDENDAPPKHSTPTLNGSRETRRTHLPSIVILHASSPGRSAGASSAPRSCARDRRRR
ncbi:MAG: hypothetical protein EOR72_15225 [Mesorhizobium sp.]|nr:MAG: hypothetical protein EOQ84_10060 [Mesorhizobium sp.]RWL34539.1 MAG: hypothetical protein EOR58_01945 [Mesorhizobium sp.]RWL35953.1 MAG: hypothetical protein EOR63_04525 [Mesorhizobium sp.]RWL41364.1 MAG: hypothetical protein EOR59_01950 [Mesorhizobium sp.]RWL59276.1 MAG: hypothetical protein EOR62_00355 [Mesorhizobium sp.]